MLPVSPLPCGRFWTRGSGKGLSAGRAASIPAWVRGACGALAFGLGSAGAVAEPGGLEGSWSGGGIVSFSSGAREQARCRVRFSRQSSTVFGMNAVCATTSARVAQTAVVERVGANRFAGTFYNPEYGVSGTISIVLGGNRLSASLKGDAGSAQLSFSR
jgi:hypothetical protein